jgi:sugar (pentulose or hexulose) kinase
LLGAVAGRVAASLDEAVGLLPMRCTSIQPDPRRAEAYETAYRGYRSLFSTLKPLFTSH